jgi:hypothetical protein
MSPNPNPTQLDLLLEALKDGNWHDSAELIALVGHRFSASLHVARKRGYVIERRRDGNYSEWRLILTDDPLTSNSDAEFAKRAKVASIHTAIAKLQRQGVTLEEIAQELEKLRSQIPAPP